SAPPGAASSAVPVGVGRFIRATANPGNTFFDGFFDGGRFARQAVDPTRKILEPIPEVFRPDPGGGIVANAAG
ncbi:hypothetical protein V6768_19985, partial [Tistrella mobilis]